jgi:hypothetical protein
MCLRNIVNNKKYFSIRMHLFTINYYRNTKIIIKTLKHVIKFPIEKERKFFLLKVSLILIKRKLKRFIYHRRH